MKPILLTVLVLCMLVTSGRTQRTDKRAIESRKDRVSHALNEYGEVRLLLMSAEQRTIRAEAAQFAAEREAQQMRDMLLVVGFVALTVGTLIPAGFGRLRQCGETRRAATGCAAVMRAPVPGAEQQTSATE